MKKHLINYAYRNLEIRRMDPNGTPISTVLLGHAMFNSFDYLFRPSGGSIADFLIQRGHRVIAFNLTGYGNSRDADASTNFDTYVEDYRSVIAELPNDVPLNYVGHSVGGMVGFSAITRGSKSFNSIILVCPALWGHTISLPPIRFAQRLQLSLALLVANSIGHLPSHLFRLGDTNAPIGYLKQLKTWAKSRRISDCRGLSYPEDWRQFKGRALVLEAGADSWMAPHENVAWIVQHLPPQAMCVRVDSTDAFEAGHFSIIYGRQAKNHIWPKLASFLEEKKWTLDT